LHTFPWQARMGRAGLRRNAVYLIRPDGYIGLADPAGDASAIEQYLAKHKIRSADQGELAAAAENGGQVASRPL
jgi:hypothetical protein